MALKEKLKKFGVGMLVSVPLWGPFVVAGIDSLTSKTINGCQVRQYKNSTVIYTSKSGFISIKELEDNNNDGIIDKKYSKICFPRRGIISLREKVTEEDQKLYQGILAKL